ncbi:MAG: heme exporter protein CcmD [Spongiibacteraceae bacterium]|nr:heme exporter protein CcmD [Spongiibacteraceae bacterium]
MQFDSLSALIDMEGHGPFVWSVYIIALVILLWLMLSPWLKNKRFFSQESMRLRREQAQKTSLPQS